MPSPGLPLAVSSTWVVNPGDPAAKAVLSPNAANASMAEPAPSRPRRLSTVIILLPLVSPRRDGQADPNLRQSNLALQKPRHASNFAAPAEDDRICDQA